MPYNEIIQELRKDKGLTQTELAKIFLTTQRTISNWECGRNEPPYEMLIKYAKYFDVSVDYILGISKQEK
ncbi:MAG: helix-turn-helix transcriptional regulator [Clostridia bacterium]|nr:helix-turn-helix transcriptional regulator [Clostridia bacterium]